MFKPLDPGYRLFGETLYLRPITGEDTLMVLTWRNAEYVRHNFFYRVTVTESDHENWLTNKVSKGLVFQFIVCLKENDEPVGSVYLQHYEASDKSMESGLFMSETMPEGRGIATEAYGLLTTEFAKELGLSKLNARIIAENTASIRVHEKCGFTPAGTTEETIVPTGERVVAVNMEKVL